MLRRTFCKSTVAAAVAAAIPGCNSGSQDTPDVGSMIPAVSSSGVELSLESSAVSELAGSLQGALFLQDDAGYNAAAAGFMGRAILGFQVGGERGECRPLAQSLLVGECEDLGIVLGRGKNRLEGGLVAQLEVLLEMAEGRHFPGGIPARLPAFDFVGEERMDIAQGTFGRTEPALALPLRASEYIRRQVRFTPFATEPVGWLIEQAGEELFLFSSDYPHPEGGRDPIARFEASLEGVSEDARERFYSRNFADMMFMS